MRVDNFPWIYSDEIKRMCVKLHINNVEIGIMNNAQDMAITFMDEHGIQNVKLDSNTVIELNKFITDRGWNTFDKVILFIIGHELAHIRYGDNKPIIRHFKEAGIPFLVMVLSVLFSI